MTGEASGWAGMVRMVSCYSERTAAHAAACAAGAASLLDLRGVEGLRVPSRLSDSLGIVSTRSKAWSICRASPAGADSMAEGTCASGAAAFRTRSGYQRALTLKKGQRSNWASRIAGERGG